MIISWLTNLQIDIIHLLKKASSEEDAFFTFI